MSEMGPEGVITKTAVVSLFRTCPVKVGRKGCNSRIHLAAPPKLILRQISETSGMPILAHAQAEPDRPGEQPDGDGADQGLQGAVRTETDRGHGLDLRLGQASPYTAKSDMAG
jgi:hypothetical protein